MAIIRERTTKLLCDVPVGQPFRLASKREHVYVLAYGPAETFKATPGRVPIVLIIDSAQYDSQDIFTAPGEVVMCSQDCRVEYLTLAKPPIYDVVG